MNNFLKLFRIFILQRLFIIVFINSHRTCSYTVKLIINKIINLLFIYFIDIVQEFTRSSRKFICRSMCFVEYISNIKKLNKRIHVNQRIFKTSKRSTVKRLNWTIKILTSISIINCTLYRQKRIFFNVFNSSWYSRFII